MTLPMKWDVRDPDHDRSVHKMRLLLDGEDVTNRVRAFDRDEGWVLLLVLNNGHPVTNKSGSGLMEECLHGDVQLVSPT